jgi:DNA polymerase III delta subunit
MVKLFHGKTAYLSMGLAKRYLDTRVDELRQLNTTFDLITIDASATAVETILNHIETPSLFFSHKIIFLKRPSQNKEKELLFQCILQHAAADHRDEGLDLVLWEDSRLPSNLRFMKALANTKGIVESPDLNKRTFRTWAKEEISSAGLQMSSDALFLLSERANYNPESFVGEVSKLSLIGKNTIAEEDIEQYCPDTLEHTVWQLIDAVNDNDSVSAEKHLESILRHGNDPHYLLLMLSRNVRLIFLTKMLLEQNNNIYQIAKKIKAPPFTIASIQKKARDMSIDRIATLYDKLTNIDYSEKTGQLDISLALHILISVI